MSERLGFSGRVARSFLQTEITPLLALLGLLLGLFAVLVTPREEEPQIDVTFANVFIPFPGASAREVEQLVTTSAEQVLSEIEGSSISTRCRDPASPFLPLNSRSARTGPDLSSAFTTHCIPTRTGCRVGWVSGNRW